MKDWVDIIGVHLYLPIQLAQRLGRMIDRINAAKAAAGVSALETWDTESAPLAPNRQAPKRRHNLTAYMRTIHDYAGSEGHSENNVYQWDSRTAWGFKQ